MAIAEYTTLPRYQDNSGTLGYVEWSKDWFSPSLQGTGVTVILAVVVASETTIGGSGTSGWTRIGPDIAIGTVDDSNTSHTITYPGGVTMGLFYAREPWGSNGSHKFSWPVSTQYAVAYVGFTGIATINTISSNFGGTSGTSNTLTAPQGFSAGQAGDLVLSVSSTRIGVNSSGTTYGPAAWSGGLGGLPTTTYTATTTGKPVALRMGGTLQATAGQALGGFTAAFTGHSTGQVPKGWLAKVATIRAESSSTRRSFVYV